jgi:flagellar biosynthesis protein FlhA
LREQLRNELGFLVSPVRFRDTVELPAGRYRVLIGGKAVAEGQIEMGRMLALGPEASLGQLGGRAVVEPAFGMMGRWLRPGRVPAARALGFAVFCPASVLSTHLLETLRQHAGSLLVREELERILRCANVEMAGPLVSILHQTLCELLPERIGLSDLTRILQLFREGLSHSTDAEHLAETIRRGLGPELYQGYLDSSGELNAIAIDLLDHYGGDRWPEAMLDALEESMEILDGAGFPPVVVTQGENRRELLSLTRQRCLRLVVLSYEELAGESALNILGEVPATALHRSR